MKRKVLPLILSICAAAPAWAQPPGEPWARHVIDAASDGADGVKLGDLNGDGLPDIVTGWEEGGITRVYLNPGYLDAQKPWPAVTVGATPHCEDAVFADLDGDGVLDVVSSCEGSTRAIFVHWGPKSQKDLLNPGAWEQQEIPALRGLTQWMYATPMVYRGKTSLVLGAKNEDAMVGLLHTTGGRDVENWEWQKLSDAGWIMSLEVLDMNGDNYPDILMSDRRGKHRGVRWLRNPGGAGRADWENFTIGETEAEVMFLGLPSFGGHEFGNILVATKDSEIRVLIRQDPTGEKWKTEVIPFPEGVGTAKAVVAGDLNGDGNHEFVITCEHARDGLHGIFGMQRIEPGHWQAFAIGGPEGIKYDRIELLDLNGNGRLDVITCEESEGERGLGVIWYENPGGASAE